MCSWAAQQDPHQHVCTSLKPSAVTLLRLHVGAPKHTHMHRYTTTNTPCASTPRGQDIPSETLCSAWSANPKSQPEYLFPVSSCWAVLGGGGWRESGRCWRWKPSLPTWFLSGSLQMPVNLTFCQLWEAVLRSAGSLLGDGAFREN